MFCARQVFRCFKSIENLGERLVGTIGPYFVGTAALLITVGAVCFCTSGSPPTPTRRLFIELFQRVYPVEVVWPTLSYPWIVTPISLLIVFNLYAHYYLVCTVPPGFVEDPPREIGTGFLWSVQKQERRQGRGSGVRWSEDLNTTPAAVTKCRKCGQQRPEVCSYPFYGSLQR
jgi:palmitoyltransferase